MNKIAKNVIMMVLIFIIAALIFSTKVEAASFTLTKSTSSVTVGESFKVTISGVYGIVSIKGNNVELSESGSKFIESGSLTITAKTKNTGNASVTVTAVDAATTGVPPQEIKEGDHKTVSVTVNPKLQTPTQTPKPATTNKTTTTTKKQTTKKEETKKEPIEEVKEKEDASSEWGISSLKLVGVKENGEEVDLSLDKEFNIKTYEYSCNVENDIKTIKVFKEAYEYNELVQISGLDEELKVGENEIILKMAKEGKDALTYKIKVVKEEPQEEVQQTSSNVEEKEKLMVSMPVFWFVILEIAIIAVSVGATVVVMKYLSKK